MLAMILGGAFWAAAAYHAARVDPRVWREPEQADVRTAALTGFPFGTEVRRGLVRGTVLNTANMVLLGAGLLCGGLWQRQGAPDSGVLFWGVLVCVGLVLVSVALGLAIIWFNVPKRLVPPHMRNEAGLVTRKLRDLRVRHQHRG
ncbi:MULTISPECIES: hypothetical protein [unclassified Streptomyces]|uniref:hypothetical protein n=1 Tax=unclassified Streptomyces TaxID=2593676 RepID=UPI002741C13B|nr:MULTISPECIES: hypothetical protein [unclassified Streptomyces]